MAALTPAAAEGLVASLERAQAELEWVANKLEEEFSRSCRKGEINTLSLLTRLNKLRRCGQWQGAREAGGGGPPLQRAASPVCSLINLGPAAAAGSCRGCRRSVTRCCRPSRGWWML
jgi:hypothetical protein